MPSPSLPPGHAKHCSRSEHKRKLLPIMELTSIFVSASSLQFFICKMRLSLLPKLSIAVGLRVVSWAGCSCGRKAEDPSVLGTHTTTAELGGPGSSPSGPWGHPIVARPWLGYLSGRASSMLTSHTSLCVVFRTLSYLAPGHDDKACVTVCQ